MADVDGYLISGTFSDPLLEQADGLETTTTFYDPKVEELIALEVSNSTAASGGGDTTVVRENPKLTRTLP